MMEVMLKPMSTRKLGTKLATLCMAWLFSCMAWLSSCASGATMGAWLGGVEWLIASCVSAAVADLGCISSLMAGFQVNKLGCMAGFAARYAPVISESISV